VKITQHATKNSRRQQELPFQERQAAQDRPRQEKRKDKGLEPVRLKNFNLNNKKFFKNFNTSRTVAVVVRNLDFV
jgi:hypothetical protein